MVTVTEREELANKQLEVAIEKAKKDKADQDEAASHYASDSRTSS